MCRLEYIIHDGWVFDTKAGEQKPSLIRREPNYNYTSLHLVFSCHVDFPLFLVHLRTLNQLVLDKSFSFPCITIVCYL